MLVVIRISGMVEVPDTIQAALFNMRLRRKYSAVLMHDTPENIKWLRNVRDFVAFGKISEQNLAKLIALRGEALKSNFKIDAKAIISGLDKKSLDELGLKPFFRLHPPRGGIESKKHFGVGKGVLGDNKEHINKLLERML